MPPTWPMVQLFGSGFGQDASTANVGMSPAWLARGSADAPISAAARKTAKACEPGYRVTAILHRRHGILPCF
jgi:hypothetical protein